MKLTKIFAIFVVMALCRLSEASAFTASYVQTISGPGLQEAQTSRVKIKDNKMRMEIDAPGGRAVTIVDGETIYSFIPARNQAVKLANKKAPDMKVLSGYAEYLESINAKVVGSEKIEGYDCDIYEFVDPRLNVPSKVWLWKKERFPVKVETKVQDGVLTTLMKDLKVGIEIDDSEFTLPPGVEILDFQEAMKQQ